MDDSDPRAKERVGTVLDEKWTLERILGSGGMGAVYAARHRNGARAAVKVLHPDLVRRTEVRERFLREGYAANRVEHRGAVQVLDDDVVKDGPDEGTAYLVMEMLEGESLQERIDRGPPVTEPEVLAILNDVLAVLEAAHEHGVVHRDLKPDNLFLSKDAGPGVKVLDFGLARLEDAASLTGVGLALGTPSFMAPEQASGRTDAIDARSDIFAIGATAFMVLAGRGVHEANGVLELVARMGTLPAPKLRDVAGHVAEDVAKIVDRALEFRREDRYPSAAAMRADVQAALQARATVSSEEAAPATREDLGSGRSAPPEEHPPGPRGAARAALVLTLLLVVGVALVVLVPRVAARSAGVLGEMRPASVTAGPPLSNGPSADDDAAAVEALATPASAATESSSDASSSATADTDAAAITDGGAVADDDDDDDVDASDVAAIAAHEAPVTASGHVASSKHPRVTPGHGKRGRPRKRRPRR